MKGPLSRPTVHRPTVSHGRAACATRTEVQAIRKQLSRTARDIELERISACALCMVRIWSYFRVTLPLLRACDPPVHEPVHPEFTEASRNNIIPEKCPTVSRGLGHDDINESFVLRSYYPPFPPCARDYPAPGHGRPGCAPRTQLAPQPNSPYNVRNILVSPRKLHRACARVYVGLLQQLAGS